MTFIKHDQEKNRLELLPVGAIEEIGRVLTYGAKKYDDHNWARGAVWSRYYGALLRHMFAWWGGEDLDPESGLPHLAHAGCCLVFLLEYARIHPETDDRPVHRPAFAFGACLKCGHRDFWFDRTVEADGTIGAIVCKQCGDVLAPNIKLTGQETEIA